MNGSFGRLFIVSEMIHSKKFAERQRSSFRFVATGGYSIFVPLYIWIQIELDLCE
jgi:hypothetical protein